MWYESENELIEVSFDGAVQYYDAPRNYCRSLVTPDLIDAVEGLDYSRGNGPSEITCNGYIAFERGGAGHREEGPAAYDPQTEEVKYALYGTFLLPEEFYRRTLGKRV